MVQTFKIPRASWYEPKELALEFPDSWEVKLFEVNDVPEIKDEEEIRNVEREVPERIREFKPELIFWLCGMDTHRDSYGTAALTEKCYPKLAKIIKQNADEWCQGKLIVKTCCNAPPHATRYIIPRIVDCLAELEKYSEG